MIKNEFFNSLKNHHVDEVKISSMWNEVEGSYGKSNRHYHTVTHLNNLIEELLPYQKRFVSWDVVVFAIAYHDIVYNALKKNNEDKSAVLAGDRLSSINFPESSITSCKQMILATKAHQPSDEPTNLFTDADLAVLGADRETYLLYVQQIRREYSIYPDMLYNPGRKKVLEHFLNMENIFKTNDFRTKYESAARTNLETELRILSR